MELIQAAIYSYILLIWYSVAFVMLALVAGLLSPGARALHSVLASSNDRLLAVLFNWRVSWAIIGPGVGYSLTNRMFDWPLVPPDGSIARKCGELIAIYCMIIWLNWHVITRGGFPLLLTGVAPGPEIGRAKVITRISLIAVGTLVTIIATRFAGPFAAYGMFAAALCALYVNYSLLRTVSFIRRWQAPEAADRSSAAVGENPVLLFLSDVHLTADGGKQTSGDPSGNVNLDCLTKRLAAEMRPRWLVVPGDLIETGNSHEWILAVDMLKRLRASGIRVILAPGNHDISTAYDPSMAYAFLREPYFRHRMLDSSKLADYLGMTALLEEELRTHDGHTLRGVWELEVGSVKNLVSRWEQAVDDALDALAKIPTFPAFSMRLAKHRPPTALRFLEFFDPLKANALLEPLIAEAMTVYATPASSAKFFPRAVWAETFTQSRACRLTPFMLALKWQHLWLDVFPLTLVDTDEGIEFVIVNSNVPEVGLFGSAFGRLTAEQIERVRQCVSKSTQSIIVVLMHHPICRWSDEPARAVRVDLNRWGLLAHDSQEARELPILLCTAAPATCRQILLCGGHVHAIARTGPLVSIDGEHAPASLKRLLILENPALPNVSGREFNKWDLRSTDLLVCERSADGILRPGRVQWSRLVA